MSGPGGRAPLHAVIATYDDAPPLGGQGVYVRDLRQALRRRGVDVRTVAGRGENAVPAHRLTGRAPLDHGLSLSLRPRPLLTPPADVVHAQGGPGGVLLVRRLPVPVVYTAHHTYRQAYGLLDPRRVPSLAERRAYHLAAMVLAVSASTADAVRHLGVEARRVEVVPPGITVPAPTEVDGRRGLLFVGRLEPEKGPLDAVRVMAAVAAARPGTPGVVVGTGHLAEAVRAAAERVPGGGVQVLGGVDDATLEACYAAAAVVLVPSRYEGLGLVALEAMAAGACVVAYDVTGLRDAVGGAGVLVPARDAAAMTAACLRLLDDAGERRARSERGRAEVTARHSWEVVAERVEQVYRAVLSDR